MTIWAGTDLAVAAGLFASALGSATVLPGQSEAVLTGLLLTDSYSPWLLVAVASAGNVLGSTINWLLGRAVERFRDRKWFPVKPAALGRAQAWYQRYGKWSLLLSWMPVIGDPLTVVAGVLREPLPIFVLLVGIAKTARYAVLAAIVLSWGG
jgi:membrane protein YqaA with SNARE-associated domain